MNGFSFCCLIGLAVSLCCLGALNGCITFLFTLVYYLASRNTTLDKSRTASDNIRQHKAMTRRTLHCHALLLTLCASLSCCVSSCRLYLAEAASSRCTCSALSLFLTLSNAQGPGGFGGIERESEGGKAEAGMMCLKVGGRTGGRKKEGMNIKGGTEIVNSLLV
jgi:hypothetical protein